MAIDINTLSNKIFKALKSFQLSLSLYTDDGTSTLSPEEARRFYNEKNNIMVNLETSDEVSKLKVNVGDNNDISEIRPMLEILKKICRTYNVQYVLRTFDKKITPKDFSYQAVTEGFTRSWGTVKTSRRRFENATLYIRHSARVNEEKRGSRSRNIQSIFVENDSGERFRFPYKNVSGAKAMCIHVSEGGTPYDENGRNILGVVKEQEKLKEFFNFAKKDVSLYENNSSLLEGVKSRIFELKNVVNSMHTKAGYHRFVENFEEQIIEENMESINIEIPEELSEAKYFVEKISMHLKEKAESEINLKEFSNEFLNGKKFIITQEIDNDDPNHPDNLDFSDEVSRNSALAQYLSTKAKDSDVFEYLNRLSEDIYKFEEKYAVFAKKMLTFLESNAIISKHSESKRTPLEEMYVNKIVNTLSQYDID